MQNKTVKIYSTPSCVYCKMAKEFLDDKGVTYEDYDVLADLIKRQEMVDKTGQMGVPVIAVDNEVIKKFWLYVKKNNLKILYDDFKKQ